MITEYCPKCHGKGIVRAVRHIEVNIPAGVDNSSRLRVQNEGEVGSGGPGDLYLYIHVLPHELFKREGNDLHLERPVDFTVAALGGEIPIATLDGTVAMKIPEGTQSGKVFRIKGHGMPDLRTGTRGNLYVRVMIQVPKRLTAEQRRLLQEFAAISDKKHEAHKGETLKEKIKKVFSEKPF